MYEAKYLHEWEVNLGSCGSEHKQLYTMDRWKATHYTNKENDKLSDELLLMMAHSQACELK